MIIKKDIENTKAVYLARFKSQRYDALTYLIIGVVIFALFIFGATIVDKTEVEGRIQNSGANLSVIFLLPVEEIDNIVIGQKVVHRLVDGRYLCEGEIIAINGEIELVDELPYQSVLSKIKIGSNAKIPAVKGMKVKTVLNSKRRLLIESLFQQKR
jgi:hypothetical protein